MWSSKRDELYNLAEKKATYNTKQHKKKLRSGEQLNREKPKWESGRPTIKWKSRVLAADYRVIYRNIASLSLSLVSEKKKLTKAMCDAGKHKGPWRKKMKKSIGDITRYYWPQTRETKKCALVGGIKNKNVNDDGIQLVWVYFSSLLSSIFILYIIIIRWKWNFFCARWERSILQSFMLRLSSSWKRPKILTYKCEVNKIRRQRRQRGVIARQWATHNTSFAVLPPFVITSHVIKIMARVKNWLSINGKRLCQHMKNGKCIWALQKFIFHSACQRESFALKFN